MIEHINPSTLHSNPAFANVVVATGIDAMVFVGGQNGIDAAGVLAGVDLGSQTTQALRNVALALDAAGASPSNVVRLAIYLVDGQDPTEAFAAARESWTGAPTAMIVLRVAGLANPAFLVEIEAIAIKASG